MRFEISTEAYKVENESGLSIKYFKKELWASSLGKLSISTKKECKSAYTDAMRVLSRNERERDKISNREMMMKKKKESDRRGET